MEANAGGANLSREEGKRGAAGAVQAEVLGASMLLGLAGLQLMETLRDVAVIGVQKINKGALILFSCLCQSEAAT